MSRIYLQRNTLDELIDRILQKNITDDLCKIILEKKYHGINKIIKESELFDNLIESCIISYVNDIIILESEIGYKLCENKVIVVINIISKEVILNYRKCIFEFNINIYISSDACHYNLYYDLSEIFKRSYKPHMLFTNKNNDDAFDYINLITLFNVFMHDVYNKDEFIWNTSIYKEKNYKFENRCLHYKNYCVKINDMRLLKNVIIIMSLIMNKLQLYFDVIPPKYIYDNYKKLK